MLQAYMQNPTSSGAKAIRKTMQLMSFKSYAEGIKMLDNFIIEEEKCKKCPNKIIIDINHYNRNIKEN